MGEILRKVCHSGWSRTWVSLSTWCPLQYQWPILTSSARCICCTKRTHWLKAQMDSQTFVAFPQQRVLYLVFFSTNSTCCSNTELLFVSSYHRDQHALLGIHILAFRQVCAPREKDETITEVFPFIFLISRIAVLNCFLYSMGPFIIKTCFSSTLENFLLCLWEFLPFYFTYCLLLFLALIFKKYFHIRRQSP